MAQALYWKVDKQEKHMQVYLKKFYVSLDLLEEIKSTEMGW